jgi:hypothetical protein
MARLKIKNSVTPGSAPAGLSFGEMAVNIVDKKIFIGNAVEGVVTLHDQNNLVTSINGVTGAITGLTASQLLVTNSNSASTVYPLFTFGAGTTAVYADITTTPLSYVPSTGTVNARIFNGTFGASNIAKIDAQSINITLTDGTNAVAFTNSEFSYNGSVPYPFTSNTGLTFSSANGIQFTNNYATPTWSYTFPTSNGTNGQALTTNGSGTLSWTTITGGLSWSAVTANRSLVAEEGVLANISSGTLTLTLPTTAALGKVIRVSGMQNTWRIAQNASQKINFGKTSTTVGTGGYLESSNARDAVELVCCVANTEWNVISSIGNITIV